MSLRRGRRDLTPLGGLAGQPALAMAQRRAAPSKPREPGEPPQRPFDPLSAFMPQHAVRWFTEYLRHRLTPKYPFPTYPTPRGDTGIYRLPEATCIALAGDWATGTDEAALVADRIRAANPDVTIHLGDVYYVGDKPEIEETCLGIVNPANGYEPCTWPKGPLGSFSLSGNHDMYAEGGKWYFETLLPALGFSGHSGQQASYFCLDHLHWRIIALDTAYNCLGVPVLENFPHMGGDCHLGQTQLEWLRDIVKPDGDERGLILLTHHQYYSSFDEAYPKPGLQLAGVIRRPVVWFWGHEHRMAAYDRYGKPGGIEAYGRCIGHGGMPVELDATVHDAGCPLRFTDTRAYPNDEGIRVGYNGLTVLTLRPDGVLTVRYEDLNGDEVLYEEWSASGGVPVVKSFRTGIGSPPART